MGPFFRKRELRERRIKLRWVWGGTAILALVVIVAYFILRPLPLPCPRKGQVINSETGSPVPNAVLECRWRLYDSPMLDGAGNYQIGALTMADKNGRFTLVVPSHRRGLWNTEIYPPTVTANGYRPFALSDWFGSVRYQGNEVVILMKPLRPGDLD